MTPSRACFTAGMAAVAVWAAGCGNGDGTTTTSAGSGGGAGSSASSASSTGTGGTGGADGGKPLDSRRVFVTSKTYQGAFGGLAGGDAECKKLADLAGLGGTWLAWLSDGAGITPPDRLTHSTVPYVLVGGGQIAANWDDLLDGSIAVPIDHDETGAAIPANGVTKVWTGTSAAGMQVGPSCMAWSPLGGGGVYGLTTATDGGWTYSAGNSCDSMDRLYCFEE